MQRVDIKLEEDVLKWAAIEAAKKGISRRQFLAECITNNYNKLTNNGK